MAGYRWVERVQTYEGTHNGWMAGYWPEVLAAMGSRERAELACAYFLAEQVWVNNPDQAFVVYNNNPAMDPCVKRGRCQRGFYLADYPTFSGAIRAFKLRLHKSRQAWRLFVAANVDWFRVALAARRLPETSVTEAVNRYRQVYGIIGDWVETNIVEHGLTL